MACKKEKKKEKIVAGLCFVRSLASVLFGGIVGYGCIAVLNSMSWPVYACGVSS